MEESGKNDANAAEKTQGQNDSDIVKHQEEGVHTPTLKAADLRKYGCVKNSLCVKGGCQLGWQFHRICAVTFVKYPLLLSFHTSVLCNIPKEGSSEKQGQLEITPVVKAIARHMSIDLSPEGFAARNRRGISIIVYGAPLTGEAITLDLYCKSN